MKKSSNEFGYKHCLDDEETVSLYGFKHYLGGEETKNFRAKFAYRFKPTFLSRFIDKMAFNLKFGEYLEKFDNAKQYGKNFRAKMVIQGSLISQNYKCSLRPKFFSCKNIQLMGTRFIGRMSTDDIDKSSNFCSKVTPCSNFFTK